MLSELPYMLMRALEAHDDLDGLGYDLLVVDEYQDLNACDLRVLHLIADRGVMLMALGDDEQSIYLVPAGPPRRDPQIPARVPGRGGLPADREPPLWSRDSRVGLPRRRGER